MESTVLGLVWGTRDMGRRNGLFKVLGSVLEYSGRVTYGTIN